MMFAFKRADPSKKVATHVKAVITALADLEKD